jgi:hypothetical protein
MDASREERRRVGQFGRPRKAARREGPRDRLLAIERASDAGESLVGEAIEQRSAPGCSRTNPGHVGVIAQKLV